MTKDETQRAIEVMQGYVSGKEIEYRDMRKSEPVWKSVAAPYLWDWFKNEYRIKPEPQTYWIQIKDHGSIVGNSYSVYSQQPGPHVEGRVIKVVEVFE